MAVEKLAVVENRIKKGVKPPFGNHPFFGLRGLNCSIRQQGNLTRLKVG